MAAPYHHTASSSQRYRPAPPAQEEGFLHYLAREGQSKLRIILIVCLIAMVVLMVSPLWFAASVPAVILLAAYILLVLATEVERRTNSRAQAADMQRSGAEDVAAAAERGATATDVDVFEDQADADQIPPDQAAIIRRESKIGVAIFLSVLLIALFIAGIAFPLPVLAIGAFVVFAYMLFVAAPLWLGWIEDDIEETSRRVGDQPPASNELQ